MPSQDPSPVKANRPGPTRSIFVALITILFLSACDDGVGVGSPASATLAFRAASSAPAGAPAGPAGAPVRSSSAPARAVAVQGSNGTLTLEEVYLIVSEVELDSDDCDDDDVDDDDFDDSDDDLFPCGDFETGPRLVQLPMDGAPIEAFQGTIAPGRYEELEFEVEDLEDDDDDDWAEIEALRNEILALVPDWPRRASIYVTGTFQPDGGEAVAFRTFVDAEIEVEMEFEPPLVIGDDDDTLLVVDIRPDLWFSNGQGGVLDLTQWDYEETGRILELEVEIEDGFAEVELDD